MHVLVISVGPVQEFIASARKCRDLWFGSWLLSELSRAAANGLVEATGREESGVLVFPGAQTSDESRSVANKIVARVEGDPRELAAAAEHRMRKRLEQIRDAAFTRVGRGDSARADMFDLETANAQVAGMIELLWASADEEGRGYEDARKEAERVLAAVKATKHWAQPAWAKDGVVKSSLDGVRESVLSEALFDRPRSGPKGAAAQRALRRRYGVHGAERLCGVGLLKRFGNEDGRLFDPESHERAHRTFSTSHVASGPFRAGLTALGPAGAAAWSAYLDELDQLSSDLGLDILSDLDVVPRCDDVTGNIDGSVLYEGRLVEEIEEACAELGRAKDVARKATQALRMFRSKVAPLGEPIPYYAILLADGDNMGAAIDGCAGFARHRELSAVLEEFASGARATVRHHDGRLVYSGGDDVLALLPLHRALECAKVLEADFRAAMSPWPGDIQGEKRAPTLSVGLAIAHALDPLGGSLDLARSAERQAKEVAGKNGLAILVQPRGGALVEVAGSFAEGFLERLEQLVALHRVDAVSARLQYELMDLADRTRTTDETLSKRLAEVREAEARRILARKQPARGRDADIAEGVLAKLDEFGAYSDPAKLGRELYVARHFAHALDQASPRARDPQRETREEAAQ